MPIPVFTPIERLCLLIIKDTPGIDLSNLCERTGGKTPKYLRAQLRTLRLFGLIHEVEANGKFTYSLVEGIRV